MKEPVIIFEKIEKSFEIGRETRLKHILPRLFTRKPQRFTALKGISFKIYKNETVGFYGPNGSGKTLILKLIAGITKPDRGKITVRGKVAPVLELGAGLHPELSGRDNIYIYSTILGVPKREVDKNLKAIIHFSELEDFIGLPVKKYSTGMRARLGFSVAIFSRPDILLIDEVLAVGDRSFQIKCVEKIRELGRSTTIVLASCSNLTLLRSLCQRVYQMREINQALQPVFDFKFLSSLPEGFEFRTQTLSSSMEPFIKKGQLVLIMKTRFQNLREGDIIAFFGEGENIVIHRIVKRIEFGKNKAGFITKGDNEPAIDPWIVGEEDYIGKVFKP